MTSNGIKAVRLVRNPENAETSGIQASSVADLLCRIINKQITAITDAKEDLFCEINLKNEHYIMLKKSIKPLPQLLSLQTFSGS